MYYTQYFFLFVSSNLCKENFIANVTRAETIIKTFCVLQLFKKVNGQFIFQAKLTNTSVLGLLNSNGWLNTFEKKNKKPQ